MKSGEQRFEKKWRITAALSSSQTCGDEVASEIAFAQPRMAHPCWRRPWGSDKWCFPLHRSYSRVNGLKIHNQWLKIMRLAKVESLRKDIEILSQSHEREVDRKDAIIQMLDKDLEARPQRAIGLSVLMQSVAGVCTSQVAT